MGIQKKVKYLLLSIIVIQVNDKLHVHENLFISTCCFTEGVEDLLKKVLYGVQLIC